MAPHALVKSEIWFSFGSWLRSFRTRRWPLPCQVPKNEIRRTSSVPPGRIPRLERPPKGGLSSCPPRITIPLGLPSLKAEKSPFTPATVAEPLTPRCIAVTVSRPLNVLLERIGASVVVPPGRGPVRIEIATGPLVRELDALFEGDARPELDPLRSSGGAEEKEHDRDEDREQASSRHPPPRVPTPLPLAPSPYEILTGLAEDLR